MINIFKITKDGLKEVSEIEKDCLINIISPTTEELEKLSNKINIPLYLLTDPLDIDERARVEKEENYILTILRIPYINEENSDVPFMCLPLGIIISEDLIITICLKEYESFFNILNGKNRKNVFTNKTRYILNIFSKTTLLYLKYLKEINNLTDRIEKELHKSMKNTELIKLLDVEKSLVYFTTSLNSNEIMMERLEKTGVLNLNIEDKDLLEDIIIDNRQAIEVANINTNILSGMMDAFASVISNNLNVVMKFLTSVTIILMIPMLVVSIMSMNVKLPFQEDPHSFFMITSISFILSLIGVIIFLRRKFF